MVHGKNRIPYRIDRRLSGLAGPDYDREGLLFQSLYYRMDDNFGYMSPINGYGGITLSHFRIKTLLPMVGDEAHNANIPQGQRMYYLEDPFREPSKIATSQRSPKSLSEPSPSPRSK